MKIALSAILLLSAGNLFAQHQHHTPAKDTVPSPHQHHQMPAKDTMPGMSHKEHDMQMPSFAPHAYSLNLPMSRNASGTAWLPDQTPMYMYMRGNDRTAFMLHGSVFLRYTHTGVGKSSQRGAGKWDAPNWLMGMVNRKVGQKGLFTAKLMISLDPLTEGGNGYPLLFQSGETYKGQRLVDRQHPHDLFSEVSVGYSHAFTKNLDVFGYAGYPGEPALGAPAFMHRVSAMNNHNAPLSHHWQDATHITFGTGTLGVRYRQFKVEGSVFTGREPDEKRYDFDKARFDSYSYRLSYNPSKNWAMQFSQGFIHSPEPLEPEANVTRTTASVAYSTIYGKDNHYNIILAWGLNDQGSGHREHAILLEDNHQFGRNAVFSRYEFVQKSSEELALEDVAGHATFNLHSFSVGYNRHLLTTGAVEWTAGTVATLNLPPDRLKSYYGNLPVGLQAYLQLRPARHRH